MHDLTLNFKYQLELELNYAIIDLAGNIKSFEHYVNNKRYDVFILDIMTKDSIYNFVTGKKICETRVGIELLTRLKAGYYKLQSPNSIVLMRTNRSSERSINNECIKNGAQKVLSPGSDDEKLVEYLKRQI